MARAEEDRFGGAIDLFTKVAGEVSPDQQEEIMEALNEHKRREAILAALESLMISAPEIRAVKALALYTTGLSNFLKDQGLEQEERLIFINELAGVEVVQLAKRE